MPNVKANRDRNNVTNIYKAEVLELEENQEDLSKDYIIDGIILSSTTNLKNLRRMCRELG